MGPRQMHKGPMAVEDLGRKGFEKRKGEGRWKRRERERQWGVEKVGREEGTWLVVINQARLR